MRGQATRLCMTATICVLGLVVSAAAAQQATSTKTEVRNFEVLAVAGNKVVVRGEKGTQEITVPEDFRFNVDGKEVSVHELKPGMKGTATITTKTTVKQVHATEVRNGEVIQAQGNSIIVRTDNGIRRFTQRDADERGATIMRDGQPAKISDLRTGDRLTATIITEGPPQTMTERQVQATLSGQPPPAAEPPAPTGAAGTAGTTPPATPAPPAAPTPSTETAAPRKLPKTASPLPVIGMLGAVSLALGAMLTAARRRRQM